MSSNEGRPNQSNNPKKVELPPLTDGEFDEVFVKSSTSEQAGRCHDALAGKARTLDLDEDQLRQLLKVLDRDPERMLGLLRRAGRGRPVHIDLPSE